MAPAGERAIVLPEVGSTGLGFVASEPRMPSKLLLPLALLVAALVAAAVLLYGGRMQPGPAPVGAPAARPAREGQPQSTLQRPQESPDSRTSDSPTAPPTPSAARAIDVVDPIQPRILEPDVDPRDTNYPPAGGIAATAAVVLGGPEAFVAAYEKYGAAERADRMLELETALAEYIHGEPKDEAGQARYFAFKDELYWWRENRR